MPWSSYAIQTDGQTDWLVRLYEKTINGLRGTGIPSEATEGVIAVNIPLLDAQAQVMRYRDILPPGHNVPTGTLKFYED